MITDKLARVNANLWAVTCFQGNLLRRHFCQDKTLALMDTEDEVIYYLAVRLRLMEF